MNSYALHGGLSLVGTYPVLFFVEPLVPRTEESPLTFTVLEGMVRSRGFVSGKLMLISSQLN
jgi:hypothetical protein